MNSNPIKIFISYRRTDSSGHTGRISDALRNKYGREQIFKDVTSIRGGVHFPSAIKKAIEESSIMVVTIGPRWAGKRFFKKARISDQTDWIRQEVEAALNGRTHILPVLVNGGEMPLKGDLPTSLHFFADLNAITVRDSKWEEDIEDVFNEIEHLVNLPRLTAPSKADEVKVENKRFSTLIPIWISLFAVLVIAYFIFTKNSDDKRPTIPQNIANGGSKGDSVTNEELISEVISDSISKSVTIFGPNSIASEINNLETTRNITGIIIGHTSNPNSKSYKGLITIKSFIDNSLQFGWSTVGWHFLVAPDGKICYGRSLDKIPAMVKDYNIGMIGIELLLNGDEELPSLEQSKSLGILLSVLSKKYGINLQENFSSNKGFVRDYSIDGKKSLKTSPGKLIKKDLIIGYINKFNKQNNL